MFNFQSRNVPWKEICLSKPVWGLTFYGIGMSFGSSAISTETPIYMNKVLGFGIEWVSLLIVLFHPHYFSD